MNNPEASAAIAQFVANTEYNALPDAVVHEAKRSLVNFFATAISACNDRPIEIALRSLQGYSGRAQASVFGRPERLDALSAAFLNAASANLTDFDDTHEPTIIHPTAPVAPALFALSELHRVSGRDLLGAFILGVEVECRLGNAVSPGHYQKGWHITATCGVFGAAMAAGKLLGLPPERLIGALGLAATQSSGLVESLGQDAKSISIGNACRNGLWSALLARDGLNGPVRPIEGRFGFMATMAETPRWEALLGGLGETWEISKNTYKPYPGGVVIHPVIDGILELKTSAPLTADQVDRIVVRGHPIVRARGDRPDVTTGREAQVSVQHSVAIALLRGKAGLAEYTDAAVQDPAVIALRKLVSVEEDPTMPVGAARVEATAKDGRTWTASVGCARGSLRRPLTDEELNDKFYALASSFRPRNDLTQLLESIWQLDEAADLAKVIAFARPAE
jgi:2-methylcitrate dehydratase PrpD